MEMLNKKLMNWASILEPNTRAQAEATARMPFIFPHLTPTPDLTSATRIAFPLLSTLISDAQVIGLPVRNVSPAANERDRAAQTGKSPDSTPTPRKV
jgi:hypothetical protein